MQSKSLAVRRPRVSVTDIVATRLLAPVAARIVKAFELDKAIREAGLNIIPLVYASRILFEALIALIMAAVISTLPFILPNPLPLRMRLLLAFIPYIIPPLVFAAGLTKPYSIRAERKRLVEEELPYLAAYMTTMAYGGLGPEKVIEKLAYSRVFRGISREARMILRDIKVFGLDPLTAIERNAATHPSRIYRDFMTGYVTTVKTGGNVAHYLEVRTQELFHHRLEETRTIAEKISLLVEVFVAVAVVATITLYTFFVVGSVIRIAGTSGLIPFMILYSFVILPAFIGVLIYSVHKSLPRAAVGAEKQLYSSLAVTVPAAIIVAATILLAFNVPFKIATRVIDTGVVTGIELAIVASLATISLGPIASYLVYLKREKGIEKQLAEFLRNLSEIRKTGLSPEKSILLVAHNRYGKLTPIVRRIAGALTLGVSLAKAVRRAIRGYTNWTLLAIMKILVDSIELGGGSPETIDAIARYTGAIADLGDELRKRLRPYFYMPYVGAVILVVSTLVLLLMLVQAAKPLSVQVAQQGVPVRFLGLTIAASPKDIAVLSVATLAGLTVDAYLMGLLAGKIRDQLLASGFIHGVILAALIALIGLPVTMMILTVTG